MIWHLLGAGAMGSMAAAYLQAAGMQVRYLARAAEVSLERQLTRPDGSIRQLCLKADNPQTINYLLIATKAGQTQAALAPWCDRLAFDATLLCLQNGIGQLDASRLPASIDPLIAVTTNAASREAGRVRLVAENSTLIGNGSASPPAWLTPLKAHWPGLSWRADIKRCQLEKLAVNAVINPLTALHDCCNGELILAPRYAELQAVAAEVDQILGRVDASWSQDTLARATQVAQATANNVSSMLADVRAGRSTEIAFINGWLVRAAARFGLGAPLNRDLLARLEAIERIAQ